jgi:signal transduction histidine kinase
MNGSDAMAEDKILVVDDDSRQIQAYMNIFAPDATAGMSLKRFIEQPSAASDEVKAPVFSVVTASQGEEAIALAAAALEKDDPIKLAFIDMRMPPGLNGLETAKRLRALDERIYIVIVTAYSDVDLKLIAHEIEDNVLFVRKPFQPEEVEQIARNFVRSWRKDRSLENLKNTLEEKVKLNLFEASMFEATNGLLAVLADKVNSQSGLVSYLNTQFDVAPQQKQTYEEVTHTIFVEAQQLSQMVRSLQRLALASDKVSVFSLGDMTNHTLSLIPELNQLPDNIRFHVDYQASKDLTFHLPYNQLVLVLTMVVRNALEAVFSQALVQNSYQGDIRLTFSEVDGQVEVLLSDNGIGVMPSDMKKIFEAGFSSKTGHAGVGLSLVRFFIDEVGGDMGFQSEGKGLGATIRLRFPFHVVTE